MEYLIVMVPGLPLLAAAITGLFSGDRRGQIAAVGTSAVLAAFIGSLALLAMALTGSTPTEVRLGGNWGILMYDPLSALMSVVISGISLIVHVYSIRYMADEQGYGRYYLLLGLMTSSLLLMWSRRLTVCRRTHSMWA